MKPSPSVLGALLAVSCPTASAVPVAFPGAEGFGRMATGGRGGAVLIVTNLDNSGAGSLREAVTASGPRTVVFEVSGTIELQSPLRITNGDLTIAGQTAPGDGICLANYTIDPSDADNVVIRFLRSRMGDIYGQEIDAFTCRYADRVIIDHCSFSWGIDEVATAYDNTNFTMQWCIISESLRNSAHPKGAHGYGGIWGGMGASFHHNLIAHHDSRNPRLNGARYHGTDRELVDFRNNVIYNWRANSCYGGEPTATGIPSKQNLVNNYYQYGPATNSGVRSRILNPSANNGYYGLFHVDGNWVNGNATVSADNWNGGVQGPSSSQLAAMRVNPPFEVAPVTTQTASAARTAVLAHAGCVRPTRDPVDTRVISEVTNGTTTYSGSVDHYPGIIDSQNDVGGWPVLASTTPPTDTDRDGMPDDWETAHDLNPNDASDRNLTDASGYTRLETYLNSLVADAFPLPEITAQPSPVSVMVGDPIALGVSASGDGTLGYQWFKDGAELVGETNASLAITSAGPGDGGDYDVEVSNAYGSVRSESATVTVSGESAPVITLEPEDTTATPGTSATFTVAAFGSAGMSYQWFTGGGNPVAGATGETLILDPVGLDQAGNYYVVVTNDHGSATSAQATLSVETSDLTTTVFSGDFSSDTIHAASPVLTPDSTNWFVMSSKNASASSVGDDPTTGGVVEARPLTLTMATTSSGVVEAAAAFSPTPVALDFPGDTLRARMSFVPSNVRCLGIGLAHSGGSAPYGGLINSELTSTKSGFATGGTQNWLGYRFSAYTASDTTQIDARPPQPGADNTSQALVVTGTSSSFPNAVATAPVASSPAPLALSDGASYLWTCGIERLADDQFLLTAALHDAANPEGAPLYSSSSITDDVASRPSAITSAFDSIAIGYRNLNNASVSTLIVSQLEITHLHGGTVSDPYAAFAFAHGLVPSNGGFLDDADADGLSNGLEFLLKGDPLDGADIPLPAVGWNASSQLVCTFPVHAEAAQVARWAIEESDDLGDWAPVAPERVATEPALDGYVPVTVTFAPSISHGFIRINALPIAP